MMTPSIRAVMLLAAGALLQGCASLPRLEAVPADLTHNAIIPGVPNARYLNSDVVAFAREILVQSEREAAALAQRGQPARPLPQANFLSISGGGDNGAFAAGLLVGWTVQGARPEFKLVTGISAGALIAPFAFLGPAYDDVLRTVATSLGPDDVIDSRNVLIGLASDAMADSEPLVRLVARYVTAQTLEAIAAEYARGRILLIGTTNLDASQGTFWNMGAIAASGAPGALDLFRKVMVASTAIPAAMPPVMIDVEAGGRRYQEMHVDGGVITQMFLYPRRSLEEVRKAAGVPYERTRRLYVIRSGRLAPKWNTTPRRTLSIAEHAIVALISTQGINDLQRMFLTAQQDGVDFNLAYIKADFDHEHPEEFDTEYMKHLFDYAYEQSVHGYPWHKAPPGP